MTPRTKEAKDPLKLVRSGVFALNRKKWKKARRKFEEALQDEEIQRNAIVWGNYGIALTNLKLFDEAKAAFSRATGLDKKNPNLWLKKGLVELQLNDYNEAIRSFERAKGLDKKDPEIPILLSRSYEKKDELKKAIKTLEGAQRKFPQSHKIPIELARLWVKLNEPEKAEMVLEVAIESTTHPDPGLLLGQTFLEKKEYDRALRIYKVILQKFPNSAHAQYGVGVAYHAKEAWSEALKAYQKATPLFRSGKPPQSLYINIARVLKRLNRNKEAIEALYKARKIAKTNLEIQLLLTELFLETQRPDRAKRMLEDATNIDKNNPTIHFFLGMTLLQIGDITHAEEEFNLSLALDPAFHESKLQLSLIALRQNKKEKAFSLAQSVVNAAPEHLPAKKLAARLAFDLQDFLRVIELLEPIVSVNPLLLEDLELLLRAWLNLKQSDRAKDFLEKLLLENNELKDSISSNSFLKQFLQTNGS
ncbi:MAG: tetratricopeptide repeat protein [Candidatus Hodarchaeota archaeon]